MKKGLVVGFIFLAIFVGGFAFAQNPFEKTTESATISDKSAVVTMDKYAQEDQILLSSFMKKENKKYASVSYVSAKQALQTVNKIGRQKVLVDKAVVSYNGKLLPNYVIVIPE